MGYCICSANNRNGFHWSVNVYKYSVFDWGEMPDHIPQKGSCLAIMAYMFFDALSDRQQWSRWSHIDADPQMLAHLQEQVNLSLSDVVKTKDLYP